MTDEQHDDDPLAEAVASYFRNRPPRDVVAPTEGEPVHVHVPDGPVPVEYVEHTVTEDVDGLPSGVTTRRLVAMAVFTPEARRALRGD